MSWTSRRRSWLKAAFRRSRLERDMESEMRDHIARRIEDLERSGLSAEEARRRALVEFGPLDARKDECREAVGLRLWNDLIGDCRYALRTLRASPGFALIAVLSLGLGIGANSAIFSLMETALWKSVPVKHPEQLRLLRWTSGPRQVMNGIWSNLDDGTVFSYPVFKALQRGSAGTATVFAFKPISNLTAVIDGHAERASCQLVSGNFYAATGVATVAGRPIAFSDDAPQAAPAAVISYAFWQRRFGGDGSAIGRTVALNQVPVTIVGVNPPAFTGMASGEHPDFFLPMALQPRVVPVDFTKPGKTLLDDPDTWWLEAMARMAPGISPEKMQARLDVVLRQAVLSTLSVKDRDMPRLRMRDGARGLDELREGAGQPLVVMLALAGLVLAIACANMANLLLSRATGRQREISMRLALGAGRGRVARQMLTEGLLLAALGGAAGIALGYGIRDAVPALLATPWEASGFQADFDVRVLAISVAVTFVTGILFSLAPMWQARRVEVNAALKDGTRSTMSLPKLLAGKSLVVFQVALSVLLLVGAGLFVRTLANLRSQNLGFDPRRILLFNVDPPRNRYPGARRLALFEELERRMAALPGVQSSTLALTVLISHNTSRTSVTPDWRPARPGNVDRAWLNFVGARYFETMGIPILSGRPIDARDGPDAPRVAVVNRKFAREFFPNRAALGQTFQTGPKEIYRIVGICGDAHYDQIQTDIPPTFYPSYRQTDPIPEMTFELKTAVSETGIVRAVRDAVGAIDRDMPVFAVRSQQEQIDNALINERLFAALTSAFGVLALVLGSIGIYGVIAYGVGRRTSEIGVRMALGARSGQVLGMILGEAALLAGAGLVIGAAAALGLTRYVAGMLYGLKASDPLTLAAAVLLMLAVALLAGWLPARRAARLDPMSALRHE